MCLPRLQLVCCARCAVNPQTHVPEQHRIAPSSRAAVALSQWPCRSGRAAVAVPQCVVVVDCGRVHRVVEDSFFVRRSSLILWRPALGSSTAATNVSSKPFAKEKILARGLASLSHRPIVPSFERVFSDLQNSQLSILHFRHRQKQMLGQRVLPTPTPTPTPTHPPANTHPSHPPPTHTGCSMRTALCPCSQVRAMRSVHLLDCAVPS